MSRRIRRTRDAQCIRFGLMAARVDIHAIESVPIPLRGFTRMPLLGLLLVTSPGVPELATNTYTRVMNRASNQSLNNIHKYMQEVMNHVSP